MKIANCPGDMRTLMKEHTHWRLYKVLAGYRYAKDLYGFGHGEVSEAGVIGVSGMHDTDEVLATINKNNKSHRILQIGNITYKENGSVIINGDVPVLWRDSAYYFARGQQIDAQQQQRRVRCVEPL